MSLCGFGVNGFAIGKKKFFPEKAAAISHISPRSYALKIYTQNNKVTHSLTQTHTHTQRENHTQIRNDLITRQVD